MSPETLLKQKKKQAAPSEDLLIDTSNMNEQQAAAMEIAEMAREEASHKDSFAGRVFLGSFVSSLMAPFSRPDEKGRAAGGGPVGEVAVRHHDAADDVEVLEQLHGAEDRRASDVGRHAQHVLHCEVGRRRKERVEHAAAAGGDAVPAQLQALDDEVEVRHETKYQLAPRLCQPYVCG